MVTLKREYQQEGPLETRKDEDAAHIEQARSPSRNLAIGTREKLLGIKGELTQEELESPIIAQAKAEIRAERKK